MKENSVFRKRHLWGGFGMTAAILASVLMLTFQSCQKDIDGPGTPESAMLKSSSMFSEESMYLDHHMFTRSTGAPVTETVVMDNPYYNCYSDLVLKIQNGNDKRTRVASAEIMIDGMMIVGPSDFNKNVTYIEKPLSGLTESSVLEVKLNSTPGSFIDLWIEGILTFITPVFTQIGPVVQDSDPPALPMVSENGITGTWSPEVINTSEKGIFTYTFTPDPGQCGEVVTMDIEIINRGTVADNEGNVYTTIKIGTQWWMSENLAATKYSNGDIIGTTMDPNQDITAETEPKYQWAYKGDESYVETYGRLYTWYAVTDSRGVCPDGWHVPSVADWTILTDYLKANGYAYEGTGIDIAKSMASTTGWTVSTIVGTPGNDPESNNSSGFNGQPAGVRLNTGIYQNMGSRGYWWTTTGSTTDILAASFRRLIYNNVNESGNIQAKTFASSVRCVKNN